MFDKLMFPQSAETWVFSVNDLLKHHTEPFEHSLFVLAHHVPILGVLKPGVVSVYETDGNTKRYFGK